MTAEALAALGRELVPHGVHPDRAPRLEPEPGSLTARGGRRSGPRPQCTVWQSKQVDIVPTAVPPQRAVACARWQETDAQVFVAGS